MLISVVGGGVTTYFIFYIIFIDEYGISYVYGLVIRTIVKIKTNLGPMYNYCKQMTTQLALSSTTLYHKEENHFICNKTLITTISICKRLTK